MNLLDYLMGPQLKSDIKSTFSGEGTLEDEAKEYYESWVREGGPTIGSTGSGEEQTFYSSPGRAGIIGQYYGRLGGVGSTEYGWRDLYGTAKQWEDLTTEQKEQLVNASRIVQETGDISAFDEVIQNNLQEFVTHRDASNVTISPGQLSETFGGPTDYNVGAGAANVDPFSRQSILENIPVAGQKYRAGDISPSLDVVEPLSLTSLLGTKTGYYTPEIEKTRKPLSKMLYDKQQQALGIGSGFEGYGRRSELGSIAEGSYLGKIEDIYANVDESRAASVDDIYSQLQDWGDLEI